LAANEKAICKHLVQFQRVPLPFPPLAFSWYLPLSSRPTRLTNVSSPSPKSTTPFELPSCRPPQIALEGIHSLASEIAPPCSSIFAFDIARLLQKVGSFGFSNIASVYRVIEKLNSLSILHLIVSDVHVVLDNGRGGTFYAEGQERTRREGFSALLAASGERPQTNSPRTLLPHIPQPPSHVRLFPRSGSPLALLPPQSF